MNVLDLLKDGALAAAELSALLLVAPASAADGPAAASPAYERPVQLHRLAAAGENDVLGALAQARITQQAAGDSKPLQATRAGHARLTEDESVADASLIDALNASSPPGGRVARLALPARAERSAPRALLVDRGAQRFVAVVLHRRVASATLVLRPVSGPSETLDLGTLDPGSALLVPIATRAQFDALDDGAIELEFEADDTTVWMTLVGQRLDADPAHADVSN